METLAAWIESTGALAYLLAPIFMVLVTILPIPAEIPAALNGMVFGLLAGTAVTWSGGLAGAVLSFELARRFGRPLGERLLSPARLAQADRVVQSAGWSGLLVLRLVPLVAFTALNWGAGFTAVRRWTFFWTTAVGILPGAIVFTVSGVGLAALYRQHPELLWPVLGLIALAAVATVLRLRRGSAAD